MDKAPEVIDLEGRKAPFFDRLTKDVEEGTETSITFDLGYTASKAILEIQRDAVKLGPLKR